jgi:predicted XRE-type DNA-binding protein
MARIAPNKPTHITKGNVFDDLGFSAGETLALKFRARILSAILDEIQKKKYRQSQLVQILDEHQPVISNLLRGKLDSMSLDKLLFYADRLGLQLEVRPRRASRKRISAA